MFKMAVTIVSFRWLEILEKEFDKNFVDLDLLIGDLDAEEPDFVYSARQKLAGLSSCFAQLTHKAQTIFQNSAKVEAELVDLRTELVNCKTRQEILEEESRSLVLQLHSLQLDRLPSNQNPEQYKEKIETALKLSPSKSVYSEEITFRNNSEIKKLKNELLQYQSENIILRNSILALHSEVYGARLAAKYLDKELAGRIQQLQLMGKEMRTDVRDKLWRQLESEILLHRHKTVIRACRNRTNHEFIETDSNLLNFSRPEARYLKNDFSVRHSDTLIKLDGDSNVHKQYNLIQKPELSQELQPIDCLSRNHKNILSKSEFLNEISSVETICNYSEKYGENIDVKNNIVSLNESPKNNYNKQKEDSFIEANSETKSIEKEVIETEEKTDVEKSDPEESAQITVKEEKKNSVSIDGEDFICVVGEKRTVIVKRQAGQGLGISITGGREHGVPILISELEVGGPAYECKNLFVGDAILKVNDISLENTSHFEAVKILTNLDTNNVKLLVQFIAVDTDEENSLSEDLYGYRYRFFDTEVMDSSDALGLHPLHSNIVHTPTAPRTPDCVSSDALGLHPLHSNIVHTPTAPRTPDCVRDDNDQSVNCIQKKHDVLNPSIQSKVMFNSANNIEEKVASTEEKSQNLIDIDTEPPKDETERLKIDLFGFQFQTDIRDVANYGNENLLDDFLVKKPESVKAEKDLIQIEVTDSKPVTEKKFEYVDENIFSGLEDHSILDNIMKSFSEDDFSYLDTEKEKNVTSDSGLEVCLSGSDFDLDKVCPEERFKDKNHLNEWVDKTPEKVELKTLQQIFDRSFSSNLSSPRGSTSFDDDILSTEHSDEKSNSVPEFKKNVLDLKNIYNVKKIQKFCPKNMEMVDEFAKKSLVKNDTVLNSKNDFNNGKKIKRSASDTVKRSKSGRKSKENLRKEVKFDKRRSSRDLEGEIPKLNDPLKKRELNFKMTDRFDENLIEYNVKNYEVNRLSPVKVDNLAPTYELEKRSEKIEEVIDEIEETRKLSKKYGLKIPGKSVKSDLNNIVVLTDVKSPEHCIKVLESHFKYFKPVLDGPLKPVEKDIKSKAFRCNKYDSFGDPDFGTPV